MDDFLSARTLSSPHAIALIAHGKPYTYAELNRYVGRFARRLLGLGVQRGQPIGALLPNGFEYVVLIHAIMRVGAILVPLNTRLTPSEIDYQLKITRCDMVICAKETAVTASELAMPLRHIISVNETHDTSILYLGNIAKDQSVDFERGELALDSPFAIVFTSGTSGQPKGALLTIGNFFYSAIASAYHIGTMPHDRWLCVLPLYHVGGLSIVLRCCLYGTTIELIGKFDALLLNQHLAENPVTLVSLVPTMLYRMLETRTQDQTPLALRLVLLGGATATPELLAKAVAFGVPIATTYGLSEATSQVATASFESVQRKVGSVGKPLLYTSVRIVDDSGNSLPQGQHGEIVVKGFTVMREYVNNPKATAKTLRDGELFTGDIGYLDEDGDLWVLQRRSDLIISGGENIYPVEVEAVLRQHPSVQEAVVVGLPNNEWGQIVGAMVVLHPHKLTTPEALIQFCRQALASYKCPRLVHIVSELPLTASGKIKRTAIAEILQQVGSP
jgi:O-succinylbenzoic acid--CoA ligase